MLSSRFIQFFRHFNLSVIRQIIWAVGDRRLPGLAAEMAYNNLFALFPTLIGITAAIGTLKMQEDSINGVLRQLTPLIPEEVVTLIEGFLQQTQLPQGETIVFLSVLVALWSASGAVSTAMNAMDQIYQTPRHHRRSFLQAKLISILLTIATIGLLITASYLIVIGNLLLHLGEWLAQLGFENFNLPGLALLQSWEVFRWGLAFGVLTIAFSILYRFGSSFWPAHLPLVPGALIAALLWAVVSQVLRFYVSHVNNFNLTYGTLSTGIVLMLWLNLSSLVVLLGAQLNVTVGEAMQHRREGKYLMRG